MVPAGQEQRRCQVGPAHTAARPRHDARPSPRRRPLDAQVVPWSGGWEVRLPLRAEQIALEKCTVVAERVTIRHNQVTDVVRVNDTIAREELQVDARRDLERT